MCVTHLIDHTLDTGSFQTNPAELLVQQDRLSRIVTVKILHFTLVKSLALPGTM